MTVLLISPGVGHAGGLQLSNRTIDFQQSSKTKAAMSIQQAAHGEASSVGQPYTE